MQGIGVGVQVRRVASRVSVICTRNFKDEEKTEILGRCTYNHQMVPSILECTHAASALSVGKQQGTSGLVLYGHPCLGFWFRLME